MPPTQHIDEHALSRLEVLWGPEALGRIRQSVIMVLGAGGVGSNCIEALVRGGVGTIVVVDGDEVVASNINRQAIAFTDTVGMRKVDAVRALAERINPSARIIARDAFVLPSDVEDLIEECRAEVGGRIDYIVDAIDTVSTKLELARVAAKQGIPLVSSMGGAMKLHPELLRFADIYETSGDALARVIRKGCRKLGIAHLDVLYSTESPKRQANDAVGAERGPLGTTSYLPPIMGQMLAGFVMQKCAQGTASAAAATGTAAVPDADAAPDAATPDAAPAPDAATPGAAAATASMQSGRAGDAR